LPTCGGQNCRIECQVCAFFKNSNAARLAMVQLLSY
jgi:hypothetical protein